MPPRIQFLVTRAIKPIATLSYQPVAPFLYPGLSLRRCASILSSLSDNKSAYNKRIRLGRGPSSGKGKTSGRGHKGQKQHGKVPAGFNGGQTPDAVVRGDKDPTYSFADEMSPINLNRIQYWIQQGRLDPSRPITVKELHKSRCLHGIKDGVKLLARGKHELTTPINIIVSRASAEAIRAVEKAGGTVVTRYYTKFAIRKIIQGKMDPINSLQSNLRLVLPSHEGADAAGGAIRPEKKRYEFRLPDPAGRKDLEYYRDEAHRGYLSHKVEEGQGPGLYFRVLGAKRDEEKKTQLPGEMSGDRNRLW